MRCCGTGRIRERGDRIICKACAGTGRITVAAATGAERIVRLNRAVLLAAALE